MNNHLVVQSSIKSKDDFISLWHSKMKQSAPLGAFEALKIFKNLHKQIKNEKVMAPRSRGVKIENVATLGSLFLNIYTCSS
jgi:hypothetical protein